MGWVKLLFTFGSVMPSLVASQIVPTEVHNTGFNSSFILTEAQIKAGDLSDTLVQNVQNVMNFDRTQMAFGGPNEDDFYTLPALTNSTILKPGQVLKVERITDPSAYAIPANTGLSRIMYTTINFNGTVIPTSGFILWPYAARTFGQALNEKAKAPIVVWAHGTSGFFGPQAPSAHRSLWYDNSGPFALAEAGYAVFAPDFAGLGIGKTWDGSEIPHQYHATPATAHDAVYGLRAALETFPESLDNNWVAMGHSEGGGVAWAVAEVLHYEESEFADLITGYKGVVAASPTTRVLTGPGYFMAPTVAQMLKSIFPSFEFSDWMTPIGVARLNLIKEIQGGIGVFTQVLANSTENVKTDFKETWYVDAFSKLGDAGHKDFKGPILVLQGTADTYVPYDVTLATVEEAWTNYPNNDLNLLAASGVGHVPILRATRQFWQKWIDERIEGKPLPQKGGVRTDVAPLRQDEQYTKIINSFPLWAGLPQFGYEVVLPV
ncbi:unnamed protein product [Clonostachys rhizophaga]|uniref:AB hydrolase-1 domain-containing protein n=1 Tax=Clonostachys rhizophaga TaxID=160324 RepID=A0A9N9VU06_9HYPO|nr:unnamed protein product [Clonostachys rhizophaga]